MSTNEANFAAAKQYAKDRGFGPVRVYDGCRVYKQDDGTYYVFNHIGLGYGDTKSGAHKCWEPECEEVTRLIHEIAATAAPFFL